MENIRYGRPDATDEECIAAATTIHADSFIRKFADGYQHKMEEGGAGLTAGEKQLISFARAILADPRILILDEATASVDTLTEAKIQAALEGVTAGRTCLMIAHRLSTVRNADMILVVKNGRIVEQGTHAQLLQLKGYYFELYTRQYTDEATAKIFQ
jgi:ATP-binding cassette subfamily B protein